MGVREALDEALEVLGQAKASGVHVRAGVASAFGCNMEGEVDASRVRTLLEAFSSVDPEEITLADTSGAIQGISAGESETQWLGAPVAPQHDQAVGLEEVRQPSGLLTVNARAILLAVVRQRHESRRRQGRPPELAKHSAHLDVDVLLGKDERRRRARSLGDAAEERVVDVVTLPARPPLSCSAKDAVAQAARETTARTVL